MELQKFLALTSGIPDPCLRIAMVKAMASAPPRRSYPRFYRQVLQELTRLRCPDRKAA